MQTINGKIAAATEAELKEFYIRNDYADIITFQGFLEYCRVNETVITDAQEGEQPAAAHQQGKEG